jgi:hypothetical protein
VSDDLNRNMSGLDAVRAELDRQGYAITNDDEIGLPADFRANFLQSYFRDDIIRHDEGDWPVDRKRARDVIRYVWSDGRLHLTQFDKITITNRAEIDGEREHARVLLLEDPQAKQLVHSLLSLVPLDRRRPEGTFGVNLFRTFTNVVTKVHRDHEEFVVLYVLERIGGGAETRLYNPADVSPEGKAIGGPVLKHQLNPGDIIIFDDERYWHDASELESPLGGTAQRDVLVCTVDYKETYLAGIA